MRATANTEKPTLSYRHGNHSCQSCSLLKCGKNSGSVTRGWKLYRQALDCVSLYHSKERRYLAEPKHSWRSAFSGDQLGEAVCYYCVCEPRKLPFPFARLKGKAEKPEDLAWNGIFTRCKEEIPLPFHRNYWEKFCLIIRKRFAKMREQNSVDISTSLWFKHVQINKPQRNSDSGLCWWCVRSVLCLHNSKWKGKSVLTRFGLPISLKMSNTTNVTVFAPGSKPPRINQRKQDGREHSLSGNCVALHAW